MTTLEERKEQLIAALDVWQEHIDPCENGHVDHGPDAHLGRRLVHTFAGMMGADWDYDGAVEYIRAADTIAVANPMHVAMGHAGAARSPEGRWIAFATKPVAASLAARGVG